MPAAGMVVGQDAQLQEGARVTEFRAAGITPPLR